MPTLTVGKRSYQLSDPRVTRQAERMFKMSPRAKKPSGRGSKDATCPRSAGVTV